MTVVVVCFCQPSWRSLQQRIRSWDVLIRKPAARSSFEPDDAADCSLAFVRQWSHVPLEPTATTDTT
ncbi:MAG: hypothetical protein ACXWPS_23660, partial [Ktedonobacteraceae bacterium]